MVGGKGILRKIGFTLLILIIVLFAVFPFLQMLSMSFKYQWDWGNPSLIPTQINWGAYGELLNIGQAEKDIPESVQILLDESDLTRQQRRG